MVSVRCSSRVREATQSFVSPRTMKRGKKGRSKVGVEEVVRGDTNQGRESLEEADALLAGISEGTNDDIRYTDGSESLPDENQIIKKNWNPEVYGFYFIDYIGGGSTIWTANFTGIVFRHSTNQTWKWEQLGYGGFTKTGTHPICFSHACK